MTHELEPCPFCGGKAEEGFEDSHMGGHVRCSECGVAGPVWSNDPNEAIEAWNRRLSSTKSEPVAVKALTDISTERQRQVDAEGWSAEHDDQYKNNEMARAAACYALAATTNNIMWRWWPWEEKWWKPTDHRRNLVKAGALIIAEIERLDRSALASEPANG